jgi:hypothetical protein
MGLFVRRTALLHAPGCGVIKVIPRGGRDVEIIASDKVEITDKKGRPMTHNRRKRLTDNGRKG